jgi:NAD(P)-dependent dehydrogenase (short-subunit alcohol dehydrogenase family)
MMDQLFDVRDMVVVVTGGLGQLGRQFSRVLCARGARVAIFDVATEEARLDKPLLQAQNEGQLMLIDADVTRRDTLARAMAVVEQTWGSPSGLINNAALDSPPDARPEENGPFETFPEDSWDQVMQVNAKGVFLTCQVVGGRMAEVGRGSIVNVSSIYGLVSPDQRLYEYRRQKGEVFYKPAAYSASKSCLFNLTRYLATYWGPRAVRVNTITLGGVFSKQDSIFLENYTARVPLGRMATEADYDGTILYLLSAASSYMTGANIVIDGGWTAW